MTTTRVDPIERLQRAARDFVEAFADAKLDPLVLVLWVVDLHTNACLDAHELGAELRRAHAAGELTFRLVIDQAKGLVSLIGVTPFGQEAVLYELERPTFVPEVFRQAFAVEDRA